MMGAEKRIEDVDEEDRPHRKMFQSPVREKVGTRSLAELRSFIG
jgi:hypothetical protein